MKAIEKYINFIGQKFSYLIPVMALLMVVVVVSRYFFGVGMTYLQELIMYFHAIVFLGCAGYVFNKDEHSHNSLEVRTKIIVLSAQYECCPKVQTKERVC